MGSKNDFYQSKHPFGDHCFEALSGRSWKPVKNIVISNGKTTLNFVDDRCTFWEKYPFKNVRVKSRQATLNDCFFFLRPGIDISVLSTSQNKDESSEIQDPVWLDARISSIERKPHETGCSCQFYVNLYRNQGSLGKTRETLTKEITEVGINQISILQKLGANYCEDRHFRWDVSEDCSGRHKAKLFKGKFSTDMVALAVTSSVREIQLDVRSVNGNLVYQIVTGAEQVASSSSSRILRALNFQVEQGITVPVEFEFMQEVLTIKDEPCDTNEATPSPYSVTGLRRSERRNVQPDRFYGCDSGSEIDIGFVRSRPYYKANQGQDEELNLLSGSDTNISNIRATPLMIDQGQDEELNVPLSILFGVSSICFKSYRYSAKKSRSYKRKASESLFETRTNTNAELKKLKSGDAKSSLLIVSFQAETDPMAFEYYRAEAKDAKYRVRKLSEKSPKRHRNDTAPRIHKNAADMDEIELEMKWETRTVLKKYTQKNKYHQTPPKHSGEARSYSRRSLSVGAYTDLINEYLKNIDINEKEKEEPDISEQWKKEKKTRNHLDPAGKTGVPVENEEEEMSETEMIWREMEMALASTYILDNEGSNVGDARGKPSDVHSDCEHDFILNEEFGILCSVCGFVFTEIRDVTPPFVQNTGWYSDDKKPNEDSLGGNPNTAAKMNFGTGEGSPNERRPEENENVWSLIPEIRAQLQLHQKKAFEFLWRNIAGSLTPESTTEEPKKTGGCVISHTPGAGKTFLIIAFLVSYLKIFPGKRPVILAPKTALYTWYKEFIKWKIPLPVYLIHGRRTYRVFRQGSVSVNYPGCPKPTDDVKHTIDCLEKIQKWHSHPSVLVMGYPSFLSLMREDSKYAHRKFMAKVLRESPGILVLDEGHNPRSTKSRLRKALMKVQTNLRILLSGTVFQNNFCEYFNTLCLARPKFVNEVLRALDPKYKKTKKKNLLGKGQMLMESRARKFFLDTIAKKIDSNTGSDRKKGLKQLKKITNKFIDVYESGGSDALPGLQIYTLLMNSTDKQHDILVKLHRIMSNFNGFPLELELLVTLGSIHPWLVKTTPCASRFFTEEELLGLDKYKYDLKRGSKVKFVLNLVHRVAKTEKILIFCHNIAPVKLFVEFFERVFGWQKGKEVLVLTGDLELFDRGRIMDSFEEPGGESRVLLASISACAEGISLTAASRVIMLDSEWNPSKTKQAIARAFRPGQQKVVYVYQLLATGTLEEDKYRRTTWKEWVSSMIFSAEFVEDPSKWQAEKIEDDVLRELVGEDKTKSFHMIMKNEKASTVIRDKE